MRDCKRRAPIGQIALCRRMPIFCCFSRPRFCAGKTRRRTRARSARKTLQSRPSAWPIRPTLILGFPTPGHPCRPGLCRRPAPQNAPSPAWGRALRRRVWILGCGGAGRLIFSAGEKMAIAGSEPARGAQEQRKGQGGMAGSATGEKSLRKARRRVARSVLAASQARRVAAGRKKMGQVTDKPSQNGQVAL